MNPAQPTASSYYDRARAVRLAIVEGARRLQEAGIDSARLDAEVLLAHVLQLDRNQLYLDSDVWFDVGAATRFEELLTRRLHREPLAYITGTREFWSLDFCVTRDVLIPRPETELVVELALELAARLTSDGPPRILDLGTGSGAIAVSLATELTDAELWAVDVSVPALAVALHNARRNGVAGRIAFAAGNLFEALRAKSGFQLIVANPPYIRGDEFAALAPEVAIWEPRQALDGGVDGLDFYRRIAAGAADLMTVGGALVLEVAADTGRQVGKLLEEAGSFTPAAIFRDYNGRERVIVSHRTGAAGRSRESR